MRIATSTITNMTTNSMNNANSIYSDIIQKISSNKNFTKISENVPDATRVLKLKDQLAKFEEYQSNIKAATAEMDLAYDSLNAVNDELIAINSLVVEASNATTSPDSAKALATEIKERVNTITDKMNTKYLDNYIFSGTYIQEPAYKLNDAGDIVYQGSTAQSGERNLTIEENKTFTYNLTGEEIFGEENLGKDFFEEMKDLDTLLTTDPLDYDKIREKLSIIQGSQENIVQANGKISAYVSKLDSAKEHNDDAIAKLTEDRTNLENVDIVKAATDLANAQTALQASYLVGTKVLGSVSLLDYI